MLLKWNNSLKIKSNTPNLTITYLPPNSKEHVKAVNLVTTHSSMFHRQYNISLLSYTVSKVRASYILSKICSCLELIQVTFSNFLIKLRHAPLAIKRGIYRLRRWWIFSVLFVVVQFAGMHRNQWTNRPEEREELTHSAWESVVCVGASGTALNIELLQCGQIISSLSRLIR